jgi:hypothetical protein
VLSIGRDRDRQSFRVKRTFAMVEKVQAALLENCSLQNGKKQNVTPAKFEP